MTLQDIVRSIDGLDDADGALTIYAADPWTPSTSAIVVRQRDDGRIPDQAVAAGCRYFLEVSIALEVLAHFPILRGHQPSEAEKCERLIEYAENDA